MTINEIVGEWLGTYIKEHSLTLTAIADAARSYGTKWSASTISQMIEGGSKADALPQLLVLLSSLNDLLEERGEKPELTLRHVFSAKEYFIISEPQHEYSMQNILTLLTETPVRLTPMGANNESMRSPALLGIGLNSVSLYSMDSNDADVFSYVALGSQPEYRYFYESGGWTLKINAGRYATSAERHMADKISFSPTSVAAICEVLYGHSLDDEASIRAGEGASPQKRGRITRILQKEIKAFSDFVKNNPVYSESRSMDEIATAFKEKMAGKTHIWSNLSTKRGVENGEH